MTMSNEVIKILNADSKVKIFMAKAKQAAINTGCTKTEWNNAKESLMCMSIQMCPKAMNLMAKEAYRELRAI